MSEEIWDTKIKKTINLEYLSSKDIDIIISLWDEKLNFSNRKLEAHFINPFYPYLKYNRNNLPIRNILASVRSHFQVFGIIEKPYLDLEFWDSHAGFYSRSFSQYKIDCIRIHFFSGSENQAMSLIKQLENGDCREDLEKDTDFKWRGYCILRPIHSFVVGRTALEFDNTPIDKIQYKIQIVEEEKGSQPFLKARQHCSANLLNAHFSVNTSEFIQQDPNLGHCATASLWVATSLMSNKFGTHKFNYRTITKQALGQWDRELETKTNNNSFPSEGALTPSEIKNAISPTGATTLTLLREKESFKESFTRLTHEIYSFMESGFPVLLCLSNAEKRSAHVVAVVGHSLPQIKNINNHINASAIFPYDQRDKKTERHYLIGNMISVYYVHDDAYGPFNRVIVPNSRKKIEEKEAQENNNGSKSFFGYKKPNKPQESLILKIGQTRSQYNLDQVLIPIEPSIKSTATSTFKDLIKIFNKHYCESYGEEAIFLWRSILIEGSEFKQSICIRNYSATLRSWYAKLHLPKYVWLFELTILKNKNISKYFYNENYSARAIDGEFIYDATVPSSHPRLISSRLPKFHADYSKTINEYVVDNTLSRYNCYEFSCKQFRKKLINKGGSCNECLDLGEKQTL